MLSAASFCYYTPNRSATRKTHMENHVSRALDSMPSESASDSHSLYEVAKALRSQVEAYCAQTDELRSLPRELFERMRDAGLFRMAHPKSQGGLQCDPLEMLMVVECLAEADASVGWCVAQTNCAALLLGMLPRTEVTRLLQRNPALVLGGVVAPKGKATATQGGVWLEGRWPFATACLHSDALGLGCLVYDPQSSVPRGLANGLPDARIALVDMQDVQVIDTWRVLGMRGSGSHDVAVDRVFVPEERLVPLIDTPRREDGALYRMPIFGMFASLVAGVALGNARGALAAQARLSIEQRSSALVHVALARSEACVRAGRAYLFEALEDCWDSAERAVAPDMQQRVALCLAATEASARAKDAVDLMYEASGAAAIADGHPLQRCFRDAHVATQHGLVSAKNLENVGKALLGVADPKLAMWPVYWG
jgi:indole-3-acetate monooxygenase